MDESLLGGPAFATDDLWPRSVFAFDESETLFKPPDLELPLLEFADKEGLYDGSLDNRLSRLEDLDGNGQYTEEAPFIQLLELEEPEKPRPPATEEHAPPDVWTLDLEAEREQAPRLKIWEAFEKKHVPHSERLTYLSEAGTTAFDAAIARHQSRGSDAGVLPQDTMLRPLCNLVLGRSSVFFQWDDSNRSFTQPLDDVPVSGLSPACSNSYVGDLIKFGTIFKNLRNSSASPIKRNKQRPALVAFKAALADILDTVERSVSTRLQTSRSLLQIQETVSRPARLLNLLEDCERAIDGFTSEDAVIAGLSDHVHFHAEAGGAFVPVLRALLARVSAPWLENLKRDVGLSTEQGSPIPQLEPRADSLNTDLAEDTFEEHAIAPKPAFLNEEDWSLITEMKASLEILRTHCSSYEVVGAPLRGRDTESGTLGKVPVTKAQVDDLEVSAWAGDDRQQLYFEALDNRLSMPPEVRFCEIGEELSSTVKATLTDDHLEVLNVTARPITLSDCNPLADLRPQLLVQSCKINSQVLRFFLNRCKLKEHFRLQHSFHLLGNGDFVSRLSAALFGVDMQSAERKRGKIPTSEVMGLRLSTRSSQQWPPASSDLQLTLMGILAESYHPSHTMHQSRHRDEAALPGGLSFSVRELSDAEIDQVMDVQSIHALDFLRLQYAPPPPLNAILTSSAMQNYDDIFRFLLKMLRVVYLTTQLKAASFRRPGRNTEEPYLREPTALFAHKAHHVASSLMSFFMSEGISTPWHDFSSSLARIERQNTASRSNDLNESSQSSATPTNGNSNSGITTLLNLHETYLDRIRSRLFLKRRQERVRKGVSDVLAATLSVAAALSSSSSSSSSSTASPPRSLESSLIRHDAAVTLLVQALLDQSRKLSRPKTALSGGGGPVAGVGEEEATEAAGELYVKLNWNGWVPAKNG